MPDSPKDDPFHGSRYREVIAWSARMEREWPLLRAALDDAPHASVLDLGCGTGEHCRFLAQRGVRAVGVDRSAAQIERARDYEDECGDLGPSFIVGEGRDVPLLTEERFGLAICLGNVLPWMEDDEVRALLAAVATRLLPGGRLLVQILNYGPVLAGAKRALPVNVSADPEHGGDELVLLRVMRPADPGHVLFFPATLRLRSGDDPPLTIERSSESRLRAWTDVDLAPVLAATGFEILERFGDVARAPFDARSSSDLVLVATRE